MKGSGPAKGRSGPIRVSKIALSCDADSEGFGFYGGPCGRFANMRPKCTDPSSGREGIELEAVGVPHDLIWGPEFTALKFPEPRLTWLRGGSRFADTGAGRWTQPSMGAPAGLPNGSSKPVGSGRVVVGFESHRGTNPGRENTPSWLGNGQHLPGFLTHHPRASQVS